MEPREGGLLQIETKRSPRDGHVLIKVRIRASASRRNMPRLFEPFFTTKKGKGSAWDCPWFTASSRNMEAPLR
jgi:C4-dicarboxylate-specific signal transduction histidine kinase